MCLFSTRTDLLPPLVSSALKALENVCGLIALRTHQCALSSDRLVNLGFSLLRGRPQRLSTLFWLRLLLCRMAFPSPFLKCCNFHSLSLPLRLLALPLTYLMSHLTSAFRSFVIVVARSLSLLGLVSLS